MKEKTSPSIQSPRRPALLRLLPLLLLLCLLCACADPAPDEIPQPSASLPLLQAADLGPDAALPAAPSADPAPALTIPAADADFPAPASSGAELFPPEPESSEGDPDFFEQPPFPAGTEALQPDPEVRRPRICLDPGHYAGVNQCIGADSYGYAEGDFDLRLGLCLQKNLEERYGIEVVMTRSTGTVSLHGYTDYALDSGHLTLRGAWAAEQDCDLFISLHTNANLNDANGFPTFQQPLAITKTVVLVNTLCARDETWLAVANEVGEEVSRTNERLGLSDGRPFRRAERGEIPPWSDEANDSLTLPGGVFCRLGENGDYYGVLRGAAEAGVPGMIVEHGFHTVPEMRYAAMYGNLAEEWAAADADAIARALGIPPVG